MITDFKYTRLQGQDIVHNLSSPSSNSNPAHKKNQNDISSP